MLGCVHCLVYGLRIGSLGASNQLNLRCQLSASGSVDCQHLIGPDVAHLQPQNEHPAQLSTLYLAATMPDVVRSM